MERWAVRLARWLDHEGTLVEETERFGPALRLFGLQRFRHGSCQSFSLHLGLRVATDPSCCAARHGLWSEALGFTRELHPLPQLADKRRETRRSAGATCWH